MKDIIVCMHGLGRTRFSMSRLARFFGRNGYHVINKGYPSRSADIATLSHDYFKPLERIIAQERVHFITHSMGGIVLRYYLQEHSLVEGSRIVMMAPPNQGSHVTDRYRDSFWYRFLGQGAQQLGSDPDSLVCQMQPLKYEVGVIAGSRSADPQFNHCFDGDHDGKVAVSHTRLDEMSDFLVVPCNHTFLMRNPDVLKQCLSFIKTGRFKHSI